MTVNVPAAAPIAPSRSIGASIVTQLPGRSASVARDAVCHVGVVVRRVGRRQWRGGDERDGDAAALGELDREGALAAARTTGEEREGHARSVVDAAHGADALPVRVLHFDASR